MRTASLALVGATGCGGVGLDPFGDTASAEEVSLTVVPTGETDYGERSPYAEPMSETFTMAPSGNSSVAIAEVTLRNTTAAFDLEVSEELRFPLLIEVGRTFTVDVVFPGPTYQDSNNQGTYSGTLVITYQLNREGDEAEITRSLLGQLCRDSDQDGDC